MELAQSANRLERVERFTNISGSINFHSWKQLFIASVNAKGLENAMQAQEANDLTAAKLLAANKADALLLFELLSSIDKEPRSWAILNHPITEIPIQWAGFLLWNAIKKRYETKAIPQEIFILKLQILLPIRHPESCFSSGLGGGKTGSGAEDYGFRGFGARISVLMVFFLLAL